ncbi:hypothetical protein MZK49_23280 [Ensifer sesbaniae]|jgi:hypothetical protein|uniref:hypothetical protein n=1 Tax=Ensifer sesbaniae TaxID=1214071 RepID=UPI00200097EC|nr:hypothetical protein [Ensifer sesbaniae]
MGYGYAYALRYFLIFALVIFVTRNLILDDAAEFDRFTVAINTSFIPVMSVSVAVFAILALACGIGKLDPQGRVYKTFSWVACSSMAAAFAWSIAVAKLAGAP